MSPDRAARRTLGLTLIELIIFIVVISIAVTGVLTLFNIGARYSADPMIGKQALSVAEAMLDEILSKDFQNDPAGPNNITPALGCTPTTAPSCQLNTPADRPNYNDVNDFNGWNQGVIQVNGTPAPVLGTYTVAVDVAPLTLNGIAGKQIAVTVVGGNQSIVLRGFRAP